MSLSDTTIFNRNCNYQVKRKGEKSSLSPGGERELLRRYCPALPSPFAIGSDSATQISLLQVIAFTVS
jgi:hypothetical protein